MNKRFQRRIERFSCGHCGAFVAGNGYTNHCPACLWSRHVDVHPGDRRETCRGMMEPVAVTQSHGVYVLLHRCAKCGAEKRNKTSADDDHDAVLRVAAGPPPAHVSGEEPRRGKFGINARRNHGGRCRDGKRPRHAAAPAI